MRRIKNFIHLLRSYYWAVRCGWPGKKLYVIGVTGTDGKTTTATLIYEILKAAGYKVGLFSTVEVKYVSNAPSDSPSLVKERKGGVRNVVEKIIGKGLHTTNPDASDLQPILGEMRNSGVTHVIIEVTSHGLDQNRVAGIDFQIGVWTNLTHEHLDYHGNMQNYAKAKAKLFRHVKYAVLNEDDSWFDNLKFKILNLNSNWKFQIVNYKKSRIKDISPSLAGEYNRYNIGAAIEVAKILGVEKRLSDQVIKEFKGVAGRREEVKNDKGFKVYVDFAHTPNALKQVLQALQAEKVSQAKLICVFGCTGERDKEKRPIMGEIATKLADIVIVTSDDTRGESQDEIARQIMKGMFNVEGLMLNKKVFKINDRREAIKKALGMARKGDVVLLAGKGHERSILLGKTEYPWNDVDEAGKILGCKK